MDERNADLAPHMEGGHADFATSFPNFQMELFKATNILGVKITTFETKNILRESTFKGLFRK